jgi:hypothetical protein
MASWGVIVNLIQTSCPPIVRCWLRDRRNCLVKTTCLFSQQLNVFPSCRTDACLYPLCGLLITLRRASLLPRKLAHSLGLVAAHKCPQVDHVAAFSCAVRMLGTHTMMHSMRGYSSATDVL